MKLPLLFPFILSFFCTFAQTNIYHPFPDSATCWIEEHYWGTWCGVIDIKYQEIAGDTVIGSFNYKRINSYIATVPSCGPSSYAITHYFMRQDTVARKIYAIPPLDNEILLYDFNKVIGDTIQFGGSIRYITNIDSVLINGTYRKRWVTDVGTYDTVFVIEGIGSTMGFLWELPGMTPMPKLMTFNANGDCYYTNQDNFYSCSCSNSINDVTATSLIKVGPNPAEKILRISSDNVIGRTGLYSITGYLIFEENILQETKDLDLSQLENGMYLLKINGSNFRIIKQ